MRGIKNPDAAGIHGQLAESWDTGCRCPDCRRQYYRTWYLANKDRAAASAKRSHLQRAYALTLEQFEDMLTKQSGLCAICKGDDFGSKGPCVDHDHSTGEVRALLCSDCNVGLGAFDDRVDLMQAAATYVARYRKRHDTTIIGLLGPAGSGKSSVAGYLVERYGAREYSLAKPLKEIAKQIFDFTDEQVYGTQKQKETPDPRYSGKTPRWFLQRLGTEGFRAVCGADVWLDLLLASIEKDAPRLAVVSDVRFINEARGIRAWRHAVDGSRLNGLVWRLESPDRETEADATHASESEWMSAPYDFLIKPVVRGLPQLFQLVDDAARHAKLFPKRPEQAL